MTDIDHNEYEINPHELMQRVLQFIQIPALISVKHSKSIKRSRALMYTQHISLTLLLINV